MNEVAQLCPTLCHPMDGSPPGSTVHGILQARILEWVAISFSRGPFQPRDRTQVSRIADRRFIALQTDALPSELAQRLKHLPAMRETWVRSLGWKDPLEKEMETHSSILAWRIPWTEEPGGLQSMESLRVRQN